MVEHSGLDDAAAGRALAADRDTPLPAHQKGFASLALLTPAQIVARRTTTASLGRPVALVDEEALDRDVSRFASYCATHGVSLAPHIKTSMSPQIFLRQMRHGAWGATVANVDQARVALAYGVRRVLIANELGGTGQVRELLDLAALHEDADLLVCVDSDASIGILLEGLDTAPAARPLGVLIEVGRPGGRAGARTLETVAASTRFVAGDPRLELRGVSAFEGVLGSDRSDEALDRVRELSRLVVDAGAVCSRLGAGEVASPLILTAGGSVYFDAVLDELTSVESHDYPRTVVLRSGAYVVHDHGYLGLLSPLASELDSALTVLAHVISVPEPGLAIIGAGKRDIGSDIAMPTVTAVVGRDGRPRELDLRVVSLNDQHAFARFDPTSTSGTPDVGDEVRLAAAHPCTTFDRWRFLAITDADGVVTDIARTYF